MKYNPTVSAAIAAILGVPAGAWAQTVSTEAGANETLAEVVVTAQRRTENLQDVPITIQALTSRDTDAAERCDVRRRAEISAERQHGQPRVPDRAK